MSGSTSQGMYDNDRPYWLALHRAPGLAGAVYPALLERFGTVQGIFAAHSDELAVCGVKKATLAYLKAPDWGAVERDLAWLGHPDRHLITLADPEYPKLLREIVDPPSVLFVMGDSSLLQTPQLAIVGSRNPSSAGIETAFRFAGQLVWAGLTVTSGLAIGIDAASHRGSLAVGGGTVAVAGTGLDKVYPTCHWDLAQTIADSGAIISEFPLGTPPRAKNFPRRNRIISGLCVGTLVVEAALRSGSLITARLAAEQGREVFAIPGSIYNPLARGCHGLIRDGAVLVESLDDILAELGPLIGVIASDAPRAG